MSDSPIVRALKDENVRLSAGGRWLTWDGSQWVVRDHRPYARRAVVLVETEDEAEAVGVLLQSEGAA